MKPECCLIIRCPHSAIYPDFVQYVNIKQMFHIFRITAITVTEVQKRLHLLIEVEGLLKP